MFKDKNTVIGFTLIFLILIVFSIINTPSKEELERIKKEKAQKEKVQKKDTVQVTNNNVTTTTNAIEPQKSKDKQIDSINLYTYPFLYAENITQDTTYYITNDLFTVGISTVGGKIKYFKFNEKHFLKWDKTPLFLINNTLHKFGLLFFSKNRLINTNKLQFEPVFYGYQPDRNLINVNKDSLKFGMRLKAFPEKDNSWIEFVYTIHKNSYLIGFNVKFNNLKEFLSETTTYVDFNIEADLMSQEKSIDNERNVTTIYYKFTDEEVEHLSETKNDKESLKTKIQWVSFKQQFFSFSLISKQGFQSGNVEVYHNQNHKNKEYLKTLLASLTIPLNYTDNFEIPLSIYSGPNKYKTMRAFKLDLERQIPLGWSFFLLAWINRFAVIPVFNFLESFNLNYGIIILILTIILKIILFPIAYKTYLSSAKMKVLRPEIEEINKKFPKKEDALKKQQALMELYKKAGVNPMSGCLPMLLQLPILIAMFRFFPASIELRQKAFLWAKDLSSYDSILDLPFHIPFYGSHVSLFTLLMTISTLIYTKINSDMMGSSNQMPGMKTIMYLMPIMFLGFFNSFSSALSYYYLLTNLITFLQMWIFRQIIDEDKIREKIKENQKRKIKKSSFQQRLEEFAKKQQLKARQQSRQQKR